jgi:16S rRNA (adenine1518-N6/adenine1519-N6)-dimethyltransferase
MKKAWRSTMDLCNINDIYALLEGSGFKFSKAMGQNFLIASWVPERISQESGADENTCVLEVGPGIGCLTQQLSYRAGKVVSVELDKRLLPVLDNSLRDCENVEIISGDIMKTDLNDLVRDHFDGLEPVVCANLPYNITSPVLTKLIESGLFKTITVMIQKEVAQRICAKPGNKDYGAFSLFVQYYTQPQMLFDVPNSCFEPRPKVTSSVIRLERREKPPVECDEKLLFKVIRAAFNQRRKTLPNAIASGFNNINKEDISSAIASAGLSPTERGEALSIEEFAKVAQELQKYIEV